LPVLLKVFSSGVEIDRIVPAPINVKDAIPGYWMNETSGVLKPAVQAYLDRRPMTPGHVGAMRAYLRQWIGAPQWIGPEIAELRELVESIVDRRTIQRWLERAESLGIDPL
jgi:hypothetical protein